MAGLLLYLGWLESASSVISTSASGVFVTVSDEVAGQALDLRMCAPDPLSECVTGQSSLAVQTDYTPPGPGELPDYGREAACGYSIAISRFQVEPQLRVCQRLCAGLNHIEN